MLRAIAPMLHAECFHAMMKNMQHTDVTIPRQVFADLVALAAEQFGSNAGRSYNGGDAFIVLGDGLGRALVAVWNVDPGLLGVVMHDYFDALALGCGRRGIECPSAAAIIEALPTVLYQRVDVDALIERVAQDASDGVWGQAAPRDVVLTQLRLPREVRAELKHRASRLGIPMSAVASEAFEAYFRKM